MPLTPLEAGLTVSLLHTQKKLMYKQARQFPYYLHEGVSDPEMKAKILVLDILQM